MPYEFQGIYSADGKCHATEMLYRGSRDCEWLDVDRSSLDYLGQPLGLNHRLFVNLANDSLLHLPTEAFITASKANDVVFELSEDFDSNNAFEEVASRANALAKRGVQFAIDDFGAGHDGLHRLYALDRVSYIKLDGTFLNACMKHKDAAEDIETLIAKWDGRGMMIVAEWIETHEAFEFAKSIGVHLFQGWLCDDKFGTDLESRIFKPLRLCNQHLSQVRSFDLIAHG